MVNTVSNFFAGNDSQVIKGMLNTVNNKKANQFVNNVINNKDIINNHKKSEIYVYCLETLSWFEDFAFVSDYNQQQLKYDFDEFNLI
ncbi:MAG: hypothetical protein ACOC22_01070 [bacterium]